MADSNVSKAQKYLNSMFGGHQDWVKLDEDGYTGAAVMEGIIRAFQIQNGVSSITGTVGPLTIGKMKSLPIIEKMDPESEGRINVCLIQCALFCKGYNAGDITGVYYTTGVAAVKQMQRDAGIAVTGKIDWKVWSGLLSMNWFQKVSGGDNTTQIIQRQLNGDWSDIIGVGPCDGIVSRQTVLSLVGALQAAEGVTTSLIADLNSVNFGEATTRAFPESLKVGQNSEWYIPFNKLVQYGLYFNGYSPDRVDGVFDTKTKNEVAKFQKFYGLTGIDLVNEGEVNVSTMKSLLTSKGDTGRKAKACDCATILNRQQAIDIKNAGYTHVGRYLTGTVGEDYIPKAMTLDEISNIKAAGLSIFPIYQDGGYELGYFKNPNQGTYDAQMAILAAERIGIPENTVIYFAVDFDCYGHQISSYIIPYFKRINLFFRSENNKKHYKIGIYAPRCVCTRVGDSALAQYSFVADMSTGFSCNLGYPLPINWAFDQFYELESFASSPSFPLDKDAYSGLDEGVSSFDTVSVKTDEEVEKENLKARIEWARVRYIYDVLDPLGYIDMGLETGITYNEKIILAEYSVDNAEVTVTAEYTQEMKMVSEGSYSIAVDVDDDGQLTAGCQSQINALTTEIDLNEAIKDKEKDIINLVSNVALSVQTGNIIFKWEMGFKQLKLIISVVSGDLVPEVSEIETGITVTVEYTITFYDDNNNQVNVEEVVKVTGTALMVAAIVVVIYLFPPNGIGALLDFLSGAGFVWINS